MRSNCASSAAESLELIRAGLAGLAASDIDGYAAAGLGAECEEILQAVGGLQLQAARRLARFETLGGPAGEDAPSDVHPGSDRAAAGDESGCADHAGASRVARLGDQRRGDRERQHVGRATGLAGQRGLCRDESRLGAPHAQLGGGVAPHGVRVVAVAPGAIDTPIGKHQGLSPERMAAVREWQTGHTPLGRIGRPEEVAWAITQLASPQASFITGVVLAVDGGAGVA